jgi:ABC-type multidrug transport system permease subunit
MGRLRELGELTRVRVLLFLREPEALFWVFVFPPLLAAVLGFAFRSGGVSPSLVGLVDGPGADDLARALEEAEHLELERFATAAEAERGLARARLDALVRPDPAGGVPRVAFDPQRPEGETARLRIELALALPAHEDGDAPHVVAREPVEATGTRYVDFLFPGLLGLNLMGTGMWGIAFAVADARRRKYLKRMIVTPMRRASFFLSFLLSRLVFLVLEMAALTAFGIWVLGVPFRGGVLGFALVSLFGALAFAGLGLLVASRVRTIEGVSGLMNLVMMPMWLGSGVFFSYERFPDAVQPWLRLLPLTAVNDALRALMLDGEGLAGQLPELAVTIAWTGIAFAVALRIFRWQ